MVRDIRNPPPLSDDFDERYSELMRAGLGHLAIRERKTRMTERMAIPPSVEKLARAMCEVMGEMPDEKFSHGFTWTPYPEKFDSSVAVPSVLMYSPKWHQLVWEAHQWIFEHSGGRLP